MLYTEENDMQYYMPVRLYAEAHCVAAHAKELCAQGTRALIVTGKKSAEINGSLSDVREALREGGVSYAHYNEIEENPSVETIMKARAFGLAEQCDFVIGIGGGSPMDAAKAIALMMRQKDKDSSYLYGASDGDYLPLVLVPTTCGSGSETTGISVLTKHDTKTKLSIPHRIYASFALLDPAYLSFLPQHVLADTSMDAFCHLAESYINVSATPYSRMCADAGLMLWRKNKDVLLQTREPALPDYENLLHASAMAGMAIAQTGTSLPHGLSYAVTYHAGMAHGKACGYFQAAYLRAADRDDAAHVLSLAGFSSPDELDDYYDRVCHRERVDGEILEYAIQDLLSNPKKMARAPFAVNEALLRQIAG